MSYRILNFLRERQSHTSGEEISRQLNMSRTAIWKHINQLRSQGYIIEAVPHLGYVLMSSPDKLLGHEIKNGLKCVDFGSHIFYHDTIDSTMNHAFNLGSQGAEEGTLVIAETQTHGRGRQGRSWVSPKGKGVYLSLILRPKLPLMDVPKLTLMTAVAMADAIKEMGDLNVQIKWPNDLLVNGKKLAGILTEMRAEVDRVDFVVLGIGLNINATAKQLIDQATSLRIETGEALNRVVVVQQILEHLEKWYHRFLNEGFDDVITSWKKYSMTLGKYVEVNDGKNIIQGEAVDLDHDGGLVLRLDNGQTIKTMAGDVALVR